MVTATNIAVVLTVITAMAIIPIITRLAEQISKPLEARVANLHISAWRVRTLALIRLGRFLRAFRSQGRGKGSGFEVYR